MNDNYDDDDNTPKMVRTLRGRLHEDRVRARGAMGSRWWVDSSGVRVKSGATRPADIGRMYDEGTATYVSHQDPRRALLEADAKRALLDVWEQHSDAWKRHDSARADLAGWIRTEEATGVWQGVASRDVHRRALDREHDYLSAITPILRGLIRAALKVYDRPDVGEVPARLT